MMFSKEANFNEVFKMKFEQPESNAKLWVLESHKYDGRAGSWFGGFDGLMVRVRVRNGDEEVKEANGQFILSRLLLVKGVNYLLYYN